MKKRAKTFLVLLCTTVCLVAGVLSILQSLGYLKAVKKVVGLP